RVNEAATPEGVDGRRVVFQGERRAAPAAAEHAELARVLGAGVPGAVHDDGAALGTVVDALVETLQAQRVAVLALVGAGGEEEAEAGLPAAVDVREAGGIPVAAAGSMRHQLMEEHPAAGEVEHPEARGGRGEGIID